MALTADWMLPVGLGIFGTLIAYLMMMKKPQSIRVKAKRTRR